VYTAAISALVERIGLFSFDTIVTLLQIANFILAGGHDDIACRC